MINDLVFVGFNSRVAAIDRGSGQTVWKWKCPHGMGYVTLLLDGGNLIVSVQGYTYCLDPENGTERWYNDLEGMGVGVASLASVRGGSTGLSAQAAADAQQRASSNNYTPAT